MTPRSHIKTLTRRTANIARAWSAFGLLTVAPLCAHADTITVPNFSFEVDVQPDGSGGGAITGWTQSANAVNQNPSSGQFTGGGGQGTPSGGDGP